MNTNTSLLITCGVCCIYPLLAFAAGVWYAKNGARVNWKFWRRDDDR